MVVVVAPATSRRWQWASMGPNRMALEVMRGGGSFKNGNRKKEKSGVIGFIMVYHGDSYISSPLNNYGLD